MTDDYVDFWRQCIVGAVQYEKTDEIDEYAKALASYHHQRHPQVSAPVECKHEHFRFLAGPDAGRVVVPKAPDWKPQLATCNDCGAALSVRPTLTIGREIEVVEDGTNG